MFNAKIGISSNWAMTSIVIFNYRLRRVSLDAIYLDAMQVCYPSVRGRVCGFTGELGAKYPSVLKLGRHVQGFSVCLHDVHMNVYI